MLGSGAIYPVPEAEILVGDFEKPDYWPRAFGMDVGWHKTAAIWGAHNRDNDLVYLTGEHYRGQAEPVIHADGIKHAAVGYLATSIRQQTAEAKSTAPNSSQSIGISVLNCRWRITLARQAFTACGCGSAQASSRCSAHAGIGSTNFASLRATKTARSLTNRSFT